MSPAEARRTARDKILDAAVAVIRQRGYAGTSVDDLCAAAGVTKGAFILAKAKGGPEAAMESVDHLRRYVELLFGVKREKLNAGE